MAAFPRSSLERALQALIVAVVLTAILSASAFPSLLSTARVLRWPALALLALLGVAYAWSNRNAGGRRPTLALALATTFIGLALVSAAWSARPQLTLGRAVALGVVLAAAWSLAAGAGNTASFQRIVDAIVVATGVVGVAGVLVLLFDHSRAIQEATTQDAARYSGVGGNPDTVMMLLAVGMPFAVHNAVVARTTRGRVAAAAVAAVAAGSIVASGSRGALLAGCGGVVVYAVLAPFGARTRLLAGAATVALAALGLLITTLPQPAKASQPSSSAATAPPANPQRYLDADRYWRLQDEIGRPPWGRTGTTAHRTVFGTSGRAEAWDGAIKLAAQRLIAGYGFGTENHVFVDRYSAFESDYVENSYIGLFLQLGLVGLLAFAALIAVLGRGLRTLARSPHTELAGIGAAAAGAVVAGLILGLSQSYIYSAGSNATAAVWISAFLLAAVTTAHRATSG